MTRPPNEPKTLQELLWYIKRFEHGIFVRERNKEGRYDAIALGDLPPDLWAKYVSGWVEEGFIPVRFREPAEMETAKEPHAQA